MGASAVVLAGIVALVSGTERKALLAPRTRFRGGQIRMLGSAAVISAAVKGWANGSIDTAVTGMVVLLMVWFSTLRVPRSAPKGAAAPAVGTPV